MTFLDPYSGNRRVTLSLLARLALLASVALLAWLVWGRLHG